MEVVTKAREDVIKADLLEMYLQFQAKQVSTIRAGWIELLRSTVPELKRLRPLSEADAATRLSYVMAMVGSRSSPGLASRAVALVVANHWTDKQACIGVQHDAMRHAAVGIVRETAPSKRRKGFIVEMIGSQLEAALAGLRLSTTGLLTRPWRTERDLIFPGGESAIRAEIEALLRDCEAAATGRQARAVFDKYIKDKRMNTFVGDFLDWGMSQLQGLPPTLIDRATSRAVPPSTTKNAGPVSPVHNSASGMVKPAPSVARLSPSAGRDRKRKRVSMTEDRSQQKRTSPTAKTREKSAVAGDTGADSGIRAPEVERRPQQRRKIDQQLSPSLSSNPGESSPEQSKSRLDASPRDVGENASLGGGDQRTAHQAHTKGLDSCTRNSESRENSSYGVPTGLRCDRAMGCEDVHAIVGRSMALWKKRGREAATLGGQQAQGSETRGMDVCSGGRRGHQASGAHVDKDPCSTDREGTDTTKESCDDQPTSESDDSDLALARTRKATNCGGKRDVPSIFRRSERNGSEYTVGNHVLVIRWRAPHVESRQTSHQCSPTTRSREQDCAAVQEQSTAPFQELQLERLVRKGAVSLNRMDGTYDVNLSDGDTTLRGVRQADLIPFFESSGDLVPDPGTDPLSSPGTDRRTAAVLDQVPNPGTDPNPDRPIDPTNINKARPSAEKLCGSSGLAQRDVGKSSSRKEPQNNELHSNVEIVDCADDDDADVQFVECKPAPAVGAGDEVRPFPSLRSQFTRQRSADERTAAETDATSIVVCDDSESDADYRPPTAEQQQLQEDVINSVGKDTPVEGTGTFQPAGDASSKETADHSEIGAEPEASKAVSNAPEARKRITALQDENLVSNCDSGRDSDAHEGTDTRIVDDEHDDFMPSDSEIRAHAQSIATMKESWREEDGSSSDSGSSSDEDRTNSKRRKWKQQRKKRFK